MWMVEMLQRFIFHCLMCAQLTKSAHYHPLMVLLNCLFVASTRWKGNTTKIYAYDTFPRWEQCKDQIIKKMIAVVASINTLLEGNITLLVIWYYFNDFLALVVCHTRQSFYHPNAFKKNIYGSNWCCIFWTNPHDICTILTGGGCHHRISAALQYSNPHNGSLENANWFVLLLGY